MRATSSVPTRRIFTVGQDNPWPAGCQVVKPPEQIGLTGVGAEPAQLMDLRPYGNPFTKNSDMGGPINQLPPKGTLSLITDDQYRSSRIPQIVS